MTGAAPAGAGRREEAGVPPRYRGLVSRTMRLGLALSLVLIAIGVAGFIAGGTGIGGGGGATPGASARTVGGDAASVLVFAGVLVLLVTPLARVGISVGLFAAAGDRPFVAITVFVLVLLVGTLVVGIVR